jgi:hypothetical protein
MEWGPLKTEALTGDRWKLTQDFVIRLSPEIPITDGSIVVPEGFVCDFASIPKRLRGIVTRTDTEYAAVLHDYGCRTGCYLTDSGALLAVPRKIIDRVFYRMLRSTPTVSLPRALLMYLGVRVGSLFD